MSSNVLYYSKRKHSERPYIFWFLGIFLLSENIRDILILQERYKHMKKDKHAPDIYQLKITIEGISPPIWRRVLLPETASFKELHALIKLLFEWDGYHLHQFSIGAGGIAGTIIGNRAALEKPSVIPEATTLLSDYLFPGGPGVLYTYDFGDNWCHSITLEKTHPSPEGEQYPQCIGGKRMAPPEGCGGIAGYYALQELYENSGDKEEELLEMIDRYGRLDFDHFNPAAYNLPALIRVGNQLDKIMLLDENEEPGSQLDSFLSDSSTILERLQSSISSKGDNRNNGLWNNYPKKGLDTLSKKDIASLTSVLRESHEHIMVYHFDRLTKEMVEKTPVISMLFYLKEIYLSQGGTLKITAEGYYISKIADLFQKQLDERAGKPAAAKKSRSREEEVPLLALLHEFLFDFDYIDEDNGAWSRLINKEFWVHPSMELICSIYEELFCYLLDTYPLTEMAVSDEPDDLEDEFIQDSIPLSLYLLKRSGQEWITSESVFTTFIELFPDYAPDWESGKKKKKVETDLLFPELKIPEAALKTYTLYSRLIFDEFALAFGLIEELEPGAMQIRDTGLGRAEMLFGQYEQMRQRKFRTTSLFDTLIEWKV